MVEMLFQTIVEITLTVSVIIVLLLVFSKLLDKNYTAKWRYWVWLVLTIRLLIPFNISLPDAPIQLYQSETTKTINSVNHHQSVRLSIEEDKEIEGRSYEIEGRPDKNTIDENSESSGDKNYTENSPVFSNNETTHHKVPVPDGFNTIKILSIVWILGGILFLSYHLIIYFSYRRKIKFSSWHATNEELLDTYRRVLEDMDVNKNVPIMMCNAIKSPMVLGFWNPILLLPDIDFTKEHLQMILRHEVIHIKRRDILYKTVILFARAAHWFNPLVHIMSVEANKDIELSCDAAVVENQNVDYRKDYSEAILMSVYKGNRRKTVFSTYFGGGKKMLEKRFAILFDLRKKKKGIISLILVVLLLGIMGLCISCNETTGERDDNFIEQEIKEAVMDYYQKRLAYREGYEAVQRDNYIIVTDLNLSSNNVREFEVTIYKIKAFGDKYLVLAKCYDGEGHPQSELHLLQKTDDRYTVSKTVFGDIPMSMAFVINSVVYKNNTILFGVLGDRTWLPGTDESKEVSFDYIITEFENGESIKETVTGDKGYIIVLEGVSDVKDMKLYNSEGELQTSLEDLDKYGSRGRDSEFSSVESFTKK
ncbi:Regulatory protein BlaR1 [Acetivibrio saccincola]|uniref:Regulatory protein BlaR1 n=3 Tax=Acetivibrio saccincola TaxID=1677857 RepID=A0A2K9E974_9FIRM|nr:Regulatory protein BlaR1 [Acetivibrio saccincola]